MSDSPDVHAPNAVRREHPFLYAWNRRLRHLHGISLRNLNLSPSNVRTRGKTIADDQYNLKTAAKILVQDETRSIHHAKSYDQLSKAVDDSSKSLPRAATQNEHITEHKNSLSPLRPARGKIRRRSTLHWASSNPRMRQFKLEAVEINRLVTSWFSIHCEEREEPIYISEVMEKSMNPSFSFFDLDASIATIVRSDHFTLRVWSKNEHTDEYRILVELRVNLRSLQFIGRSLETFHHPLPENCVLLHLSDGIYTSFTDLPAESQHLPPLTAAMKATAPTQAASFDALIKLANLDEVIQDALRTRARLEDDIDKLLAGMPRAEQALSELSSQREELKNTRRAREIEQKNLASVVKVKSDLQASLETRRKLVRSLPESRERVEENCKQYASARQKLQKELDNVGENSNGQIRRICTALMQIFPIEPVRNKTLQFSIRGIHLPNSTFSDTNGDEIAAALGYTAQLVYRLSLYLFIPLPYTIELNESNSFIRDDVSAGIAQRQFPLQPLGASYKFEYGVFLLNKDIEFLMSRTGLRIMDIRHTLPNLKYLMFVLTAGSGELPIRKAGGVRGLLRDRLTPSLSRRNSDDSVTSQTSGMINDDKMALLAQQEKTGGFDDAIVNGPVRARGLPYKRSMLRDAG